MNILLPIAGLGSRFSKVGFELPKPLIKVEGKPMIQRAIESLGVQGNYIFIIRDNETLKLHLQSIYPDSNIISN